MKITSAYAGTKSFDRSTLLFTFHGRPVIDEGTVQSLGLTESDNALYVFPKVRTAFNSTFSFIIQLTFSKNLAPQQDSPSASKNVGGSLDAAGFWSDFFLLVYVSMHGSCHRRTNTI